MNIFASLPSFGHWMVKDSRSFTEEERNSVSSAVVVPSQYGNSVCFSMISGGVTYIPLSNASTLGVGETVDMSKAKLLTLGKQGEKDIFRVEI